MPRKPLTPEQRERKRVMDKAWRERNKEHIRAYQKAYDAARKARSRPGRYKPVPKDETPEQRKARRAANQAEWLARVRADPEALAAYRARRAARQRAYWDKLTPEQRYERDKAFRERLDADPARKEAYLATKRAWARKRRAIRRDMRKQAAAPVGEVFRSKLYTNEMYAAVMAELVAMRPGDYRDDLAAEAILLMLEGEADPKAAVKAARKALNKDRFKTVSMDAANACGKTLHDYITEEVYQ